MGKAEVGSTKHLSKQMKAKGLQRLRWYCQPCERQMRDDNAFKQHCMSESHVRQMLLVGEDPKKFLREYSDQFLRDFIQLLKTGHRDKMVQINHFYQEYIANKEHVHMNSTQWSSLTEFAKYLGKESICRVEENEKGIHIAWIDNSPEALKRQEALRRKEAQDRGDDEWEQRMLKEQIRRAHKEAATRGDESRPLVGGKPVKVQEGGRIKLSFGAAVKPDAATAAATGDTTKDETQNQDQPSGAEQAADAKETTEADADSGAVKDPGSNSKEAAQTGPKPIGGIKFGVKPAPKNVFAQARKNALVAGAGVKAAKIAEPPKKMSEAERIMREEMARKRPREFIGAGSGSSSKRRRQDG